MIKIVRLRSEFVFGRVCTLVWGEFTLQRLQENACLTSLAVILVICLARGVNLLSSAVLRATSIVLDVF